MYETDMAIITEFDIPVTEFALAEVMRETVILQVEIERLVAHDYGKLMPFTWITTEDFETMDELLASDDTVDRFRNVSELDEFRLYRMEWVDHIEMIVHILLEEDGAILSASGGDDGWHFRVLFPDRRALSETYEFATDSDLTFDVKKVYEMENERRGRFGLSKNQYETLELATKRGYFEVPRTITIDDLAEEIGITHQSLSERLRRAQRTLNENAILIGRDDYDSIQERAGTS